MNSVGKDFMNYRYHVVAVAFLGLVVHFHHGDTLGTASLAQTIAGDTSTTDAATTDSHVKVLKLKSKSGKDILVTLKEQQSALDDLAKWRKEKPKTQVSVSATEGGVPLTCDCMASPLDGNLDQVKDSQNIVTVLENIKKVADDADEKAKQATLEEQQKKDRCEVGDRTEQLDCLQQKLSSRDIDQDRKNELRQTLFNLLQDGMNDHGHEDEIMAYLKSHKNILKLLDGSQQETLSTLGAQYLAGKAAKKINDDLEKKVQPKIDAALAAYNNGNIAGYQNYMYQAAQAEQSATTSSANQAYRQFQSEFRSTFGAGKTQNLTTAWDSANTMNSANVNHYQIILKNYGNPQVAAAEAQKLTFMTDMYDGQMAMSKLFGATGSLFANASATVTGSSDSAIDAACLNVGQRSQCNRRGRSLTGTRSVRPSLNGQNIFSDYITRLQQINTAALGDHGLQTNMLNSFSNPASTYSSNQVVRPATVTPGTGRSTRPALGGLAFY
jgi:hypothetical protein